MQVLQMQQIQQGMEMQQQTAAERKKAAEQGELDQNLLRQNFAPLPGPTPDGSPLMPNRPDPRFMLGQGASLGGVERAMQLDQLLNPQAKPQDPLAGFDKVSPKDYTPESLAAFVQTRDPSVLRAAPKEDNAPSDWKLYTLSGAPQRGLTFDQWDMARRQAGAPKAPVVNMYNTDSAKAETDLRKEFGDIPQVKRFNSALPAYKAVEDAAKRNTTQADINLVYGIAKLYDPESVVREGEYGTIASSQSIPEKIKGIAQYLSGGGRLTPETKAQLLTEARGRIGTFKTELDAARTTYEGIAKRRNLDPLNIFIQPSDIGPLNSPANDLASAAAAELARRRRNGSQ
jgi:hypothetical protein